MSKDNSTGSGDDELRRRLEVLREQFEQGKISIAAPIADEMKRSLLAVRYGPDGKIDLSTVDSRVRAFALAVTGMHDREEMKKSLSLREIQETYFGWLETNFGDYYHMMVDRRLTPHQVGSMASKNADIVKYTASVVSEFMEALTEFWEGAIEPAYAHLKDMNCLKAVFGGDFFPSSSQNIAAKCGLY